MLEYLGSVRLESQKKNDSGQLCHAKLMWSKTRGSCAINQQVAWSTVSWHPCKHVISRHDDTCIVGSWVFAPSPFAPDKSITGQIVEILCQETDQSSVIVLLDLFETLSERHAIFGMPVLTRPFGEQRIVAVAGKVGYSVSIH